MKQQIFTKDTAEKLNQLAREQMKLKLLADIQMDMEICKLEGWDVVGYLLDLNKILSSLIKNQSHERRN